MTNFGGGNKMIVGKVEVKRIVDKIVDDEGNPVCMNMKNGQFIGTCPFVNAIQYEEQDIDARCLFPKKDKKLKVKGDNVIPYKGCPVWAGEEK